MVFESIDNSRDDVAFYGKQIRRDIRYDEDVYAAISHMAA